MDNTIVVSIIAASASIVVAAITYWTTKSREREADWRKEKLIHYKEYMSALSGILGSNSSPESKKRYTFAFNSVALFASQQVIECLHQYQELTRLSQVPLEAHDKLLTNLVLAIRQDLKLNPKDNALTFKFHVIST
ncbi:hypothetical protein [uncultured Tolumonas sp.]|uniref:hypothetical protein n=1 Tax=uncultured Tolumonas sp. TaxID=263765 RepID=UPI00292E5E52|nr:hypothetical protein [uncultured Tolumonas sp.]